MMKSLLRPIFVTLCLAGFANGQQVPYFSGKTAFDLLEKQVAFGPRVPGSPGHARMVAFVDSMLTELADEIRIQRVSTTQPYTGEAMTITNFLARFSPATERRIMVLAHYDTRSAADKDPVVSNRNKPIARANDGASGTAIVLHLAQLLHRQSPLIGVDLLLVDAEDIGRSGELENFSLGTKAFVADMENQLQGHYPEYAILLDMVGDKNLSLPMEYFSLRDAREVMMKVWRLARDLGYDQFKMVYGPAVYDDHVPLMEAGIPAIDIIDFEYPDESNSYWHSLDDTPDKCSPESLEAVGTVVTTLIYGEEP